MNKVLKDLRLEKNITLIQMAELIDLKTSSAYWKKEMGLVPFSLQEAKVISVFFKRRIEDLFFADKVS